MLLKLSVIALQNVNSATTVTESFATVSLCCFCWHKSSTIGDNSTQQQQQHESNRNAVGQLCK